MNNVSLGVVSDTYGLLSRFGSAFPTELSNYAKSDTI